MKLGYKETVNGIDVHVYREVERVHGRDSAVPTYIGGDISFSMEEGGSGKELIKNLIDGSVVYLEERIATWRTYATKIFYSMDKSDKKAIINFTLTIVGMES